MAGRELKALIAAYRDRDDLAFRRAAHTIIEEEEAKRHTALARELRKLLASGTDLAPNSPQYEATEPPRSRDSDLPLVETRRPRRSFESLVIPRQLRDRLEEIVEEVRLWPELDKAGVPRRQSVLLFGPPGTGKTSIGEVLATELGRTLAIARTDTLVSSFLGETASNIAKVFEFANSGPYVLLFDEFDSLGKTREDVSDHGELRRVVNTFLQLIDSYSGPSVIVAATNHERVLDSALWRRFSEVLELPLPDWEQRLKLLRSLLSNQAEHLLDLDSVARELDGLPQAAVERTAVEARRIALLDRRQMVEREDLNEALRRVRHRRWF